MTRWNKFMFAHTCHRRTSSKRRFSKMTRSRTQFYCNQLQNRLQLLLLLQHLFWPNYQTVGTNWYVLLIEFSCLSDSFSMPPLWVIASVKCEKQCNVFHDRQMRQYTYQKHLKYQLNPRYRCARCLTSRLSGRVLNMCGSDIYILILNRMLHRTLLQRIMWWVLTKSPERYWIHSL